LGALVGDEDGDSDEHWYCPPHPESFRHLLFQQQTANISNERAPSNIDCMVLTDETSQDDKSWLNDSASSNIPHMLVTDETSQDDKS